MVQELIDKAKTKFPISIYYTGQLSEEDISALKEVCDVRCPSVYMSGSATYSIRYRGTANDDEKKNHAMKKIICAVLILVTILSLSGCVDTFKAFFPKESKDIERSTSSVKNTFSVIGGLSEAKEAFKDVDLDDMSEEELEELFNGVLK